MNEKKVKLRMGMHNKVTIDRWQAIKDDTKANLPVAKIAKRNSVSESTVRKVRRSNNFHEYRLSNDKSIHKPLTVIAPTSGLPFEDFGRKPLFFASKKVKPSIVVSNRLDREAERTARCLGLMLLGVIGIIIVALVIIMVTGSKQ